MKNGQSAIEALVLIGLMTFFLIITIAAVSDEIIKADDESYTSLLAEIADVIESEALIAFGSENGYYHQFTLPPTLNSQPYTTGMHNSTSIAGNQGNVTTLSVASKKLNVHANITRNLPRDVRGNLVRGQNTVRKEQGIVVFRPVPLTAAQQADCGASCSGSVTVEECCDHMSLCCA